MHFERVGLDLIFFFFLSIHFYTARIKCVLPQIRDPNSFFCLKETDYVPNPNVIHSLKNYLIYGKNILISYFCVVKFFWYIKVLRMNKE